MVLSIFKTKAEANKSKIDASEAYNLWDIAKSAYDAIHRVQIYENFTHDPDLTYIAGKFRQSLKSHIDIVEKLLSKYSIKGPDAPIVDINSAINSQVLNDQYMATQMFIYAQESIEMVLRAIRTSTTNDEIRTALINMVKRMVKREGMLSKYMKLKGWVANPPLFPHLPVATIDKIDCAEAFHLWDHLTYRYDNIKLTQLMYAYANDGDFKILLKTGLQSTLNKQAKLLEKELNHFGIPVPIHPPTVMPTAESSELFEDDFMFRLLIMGIQGTAILHAQALKQCVTNDRVRKIFEQLLFEEIDMHSSLIKYGKVKGWFNVVPEYGTGI